MILANLHNNQTRFHCPLYFLIKIGALKPLKMFFYLKMGIFVFII